ncbi:bacteriophage abortive infection AbiH family protein [Bacillus sp. A17A.1]
MNFDAVERVIIIGHSLGEVDLPYFRKVKKRVNQNTECMFIITVRMKLKILEIN